MSRREQSRKRQYRHCVICEACKKEIDSDYKDGHTKNVHKGVKVKCSKVVDANQLHLSQFFVRSSRDQQTMSLFFGLYPLSST